ncbi:Nucleoporin nup44 [Taphrina deformans PYCC 5710]|uniref:Nucleoporin nup44 n=1 Tax=Taphrina deformans (strain PYCC 5710 / ATCC 11124 / CBS 356.35 / IMI 108563 / JCM 9778 / NBRC 8474) TaxID=1097556 RepID=R4X6P3_TAPDE|nr:Nucleoporin nup44 [Taphrina deformans PYCC 5710]|eukprot:CCG80561.1 Nucleoporin nup44 [Taphrina deformans PYCC 5710]
MAFSFGTPATSDKPAASFNFGSSIPSQTPSLFGSQQNGGAATTNSFNFGNTNANQSQAQSKPAFSFGASSTSANTTNGNNNTPAFSFGGGNTNGSTNLNAGQTNQNQSGNNSNLFGQQNTTNSNSGNLFSQANTQQPTGGMFGQQLNQSQGLFGNNAQSTQTSSIFGQPSTQQQPQQPSTTNLFGNQGNNTNQQQTQNPSLGSSFFSQNQQTQQNQPSQFQQSVQNAQPSLAQSIYGQTSSQPQFSWSRPQNQAQTTMPSFNMPAMSMRQSIYAPTQTYNPGASTSMNGGQSTYGPSQPASIQEQLLKLKNAWDPTHPECMFQAYFYNRVAPETASLYTKPSDHKQSAWDDAVTNRPDNSVVPVLAKGFTDLGTRVKLQEQQIFAYRTRIHEIANKLKELMDRHVLHAEPKIDTARRRHIELSRRALQLAAKVQVLKCRGYALRPEEDQLRTRLQTLEGQLHDPTTFGRVGELWAKMTLLRLKQKAAEEDIKAKGYVSTIDFEASNGLENIEQALRDQNNGLQFVSGIVRDDLAKLESQMQKYQSAQSGMDKSKGQ